MTIEITRDLACNRIALFASEGRLIQSEWHTERDGRHLACLLGAIDKEIDDPAKCPANVMPAWMANLLPTLFDGVSEEKAPSYGTRFASALRTGNTDESVMRKFLVACIESAVVSAKPASEGKSYWADVESSCATVVTLLSSPKKPTKATRAAARAAAYAATDAARAAAYAAAYATRAAAHAAAYAATDAARAAAYAATDAARAIDVAAYAARVAAYAARAAAYAATDAAHAIDVAAYAARAAAHEKLFDALLSAMVN